MNGKYWWTDRLTHRPTDKQTTFKQHALPSSKGVGGGWADKCHATQKSKLNYVVESFTLQR